MLDEALSVTNQLQELGVPLDGKSRFQMNIMVRKPTSLDHLANFKDGSILPIAWFEVVSVPCTVSNLP
jgi:hypothetical protein